MTILGIETSCDETAAAVVKGISRNKLMKVLSNVVASSEELHKKTGGIVPEVAARKQIEFMIPLLVEALDGIKTQEIDAIAVTVGPGLVGSLLVGVETAKALAFAWKKPLIPVNHLVAHLYANWISENPKSQISNPKQLQNNKSKIQKGAVPQFPAVGLVASGGHTDLVLIEGHGKLRYLGATRDDAAGEAFDKIARMLGLGYPGGPATEKAARKVKSKKSKVKSISLPRPMIDSEDYDFSFSGLKTAVLRQAQDKFMRGKLGKEFVPRLAYEVQEAIVEVLVAKVVRAVKEFSPKSVLISGGVTANSRLRQLMESGIRNQESGIELFIPPVDLCTDNAASIAAAVYYNYPSLAEPAGRRGRVRADKSPVPWQMIKVDPGLAIVN